MSNIKQLGLEYAYVATHVTELQTICHERAKASGWWTDVESGDLFSKDAISRMVPEKLMLTVSELSEAMEAHRKSLQDDHLPHRSGVEVELADAVIRIFDLAGALGFDLGAAMSEKLAYNAQRIDHTLAHRRSAGGKRY